MDVLRWAYKYVGISVGLKMGYFRVPKDEGIFGRSKGGSISVGLQMEVFG